MLLPFLPEELSLNGGYEEILSRLYREFSLRIKSKNFKYKGLPIVFDNRRVNSPYEEGFWHVITRGKDTRLVDFKRAKRLVWLRPLVENSDAPELYKWIEQDHDKKGKLTTKTYIWYREGRYLIVLKEIPDRYFLTTAFYVTGERNDKYYLRKFEKAQKKGPGC